MQRWKGWFAVAALGAAAMGWSACAAGTPSSALAGGSGDAGGVGSAGTTASGDDAGDSGVPSFLDASPCDDRCSADLHSILDCNGAVVTTCPPDQGCGATGCVPACEAAQANQSTIGCDYYSLETDVISDLGGGTLCAAAYVTNTWTTPVTIQVERGGTMIDAASIAYLRESSGSWRSKSSKEMASYRATNAHSSRRPASSSASGSTQRIVASPMIVSFVLPGEGWTRPQRGVKRSPVRMRAYGWEES